MATSTIQRTPGAQQASKYPFVGNNYRQYGEQPGYIYYPYTDQYYVDPKAVNALKEQQGLGPPKQPGLGSTLLPVAGVLGAGYAATEIGKGVGQRIGGMFGTGEAAAQTGNAAAGAGAAGAGSAAPGATGMLGAGSSAAQGGASTATQAAWNAGADAATGAASSAPTGMLGGGASTPTTGVIGGGGEGAAATGAEGATVGTGQAILGGAGVALGTYQAIQGIKNKNPVQAGLGGAVAGLGVNGLGYALGPWGWAAMIAAPAALGYINKLGDKDRWKTEINRLNELKKNGTFVPDAVINARTNYDAAMRGRKKEDFVNPNFANDYIGFDNQGNWVNNKFALSRNEADLRPEDIINNAAFAQKDPEWFRRPLQERLAYAKSVLDAGQVRERYLSIELGNELPKPTFSGTLIDPNAANSGSTGSMMTKPYITQGPARSMTSSPGISLSGQRISYDPRSQSFGPPRSKTVSPGILKSGKRVDYSKKEKNKDL